MQIYLYDGTTGEYAGSKQARVLPKREDRPDDDVTKWQIPALATTIQPPATEEGETVLFDAELGVWNVIDDPRGEVWYDANRKPVTITKLGQSTDGLYESLADVPITKADVDGEMLRRINLGVEYSGVVYDADMGSQLVIDQFVNVANAAIADGVQAGDMRWHGGDADFVWIAKDNSQVALDAMGMQGLGKALALHINKHRIKAAVIKTLSPLPADYADDIRWA